MHKILLVEDDEVIRQQVKKMLEQWGYEVVLVEDFMEVLSIFVKVEPHLVLMDIGLPLCGKCWRLSSQATFREDC